MSYSVLYKPIKTIYKVLYYVDIGLHGANFWIVKVVDIKHFNPQHKKVCN